MEKLVTHVNQYQKFIQLVVENSSKNPIKSPNGAKSKCSYVYFWGPILIGLKMGGRISLIIYFIVSACCLGPEATFKLDHLKLKASKASKQFIPCLFEVPPGKG